MTDQELIFSAMRQVGVIVAEHLESGAGDADEVITQLIAVLDTQELAAAMNRVERGYGLRVVKSQLAERQPPTECVVTPKTK